MREKYNDQKVDNNTKSKSELRKIKNDSIERHANRTQFINKEMILRNQKIEKVLNQSIQIEKEKSMELGSKINQKTVRKKLLKYEEKIGLLTAFINLGVRENFKQLL